MDQTGRDDRCLIQIPLINIEVEMPRVRKGVGSDGEHKVFNDAE